jgi:glycosyltransferase 2 family protein
MTAEISIPRLEQHWWTIGISIALAALLYLAGVVYSGWQDVWSAALRIGFGGIALTLLLSLSNYGIRFIRWARYLKALGHPLPWRQNLNIYLAGFALTTTPGKSGELVRSLLLKRRGMGYAESVAAFVAERASDLMALLALLAMVSFLGGFSHPKAWLVSLTAVALLAGLLLILGRPAVVKRLHDWLENTGWRQLARLAWLGVKMSNHFQLCTRGRPLWWGLALGMLAWSAEGTGFYLVAQLAGSSNIAWEQAVFIYAFATLVGALTFLPGGLGSAEATMLGLLIASGVGHGEAVAITVVARMATLWFGVSIGIVALALASRVRA